MVIGLTGPNASGKGEAVNYLISKGFKHISLSDILREEAKKINLELSRENLITLGNKLRREKGPSALALEAIKHISQNHNWVVDSIRNPAEIKALQKVNGFTLLGITAPVEIRFKRSLARKRPGDAQALQDFIEKEKKENVSSFENQQLENCMKSADTIINNDSTLQEFYEKIQACMG